MRVVLVETNGRELSFFRELLGEMAENVFALSEHDVTSLLLKAQGADMIAVGRFTWQPDDTELCHRIYGERVGLPLIAVSGPAAPEVRAQALRAGADEFMSIPFDVEELFARVGALIRLASTPGHVRLGGFHLDLGSRRLHVMGARVSLTPREFDIVAALVERAGHVVTRAELAERIGSAAARDSNIVDVHVSRIRDALGARASAIETVRGHGYRFRRP